MAGLMDFLGLGGAGAYDDLLSEEQKKRMQQQTMMTMAAKLLQAGGPSTTRTNLGQALGGAYLSGQEAYQKAGSDALTQMLTKQKIEEYKRGRQTDQMIQQFLGGGGSPAQAAAAPQPNQMGPGGVPFPVTQQPAQQQPAAQQAAGLASRAAAMADKYRQIGMALSVQDPTKANQYFTMADKLAPQVKPQGQPFTVKDPTNPGQNILVQQYSDGSIKPVTGYQPAGMSEADRLRFGLDLARFGLSKQEFDRGGYTLQQTDKGFAYVPKVPGMPVIPLMAGGMPAPDTAAPGAAQAAPGGVPGAGQQQQLKPAGAKPTADQSNAVGFSQRMERAEALLGTFADYPGTGTAIAESVPFIGGFLGRQVMSPEQQKYKQAAGDWIRAKLRKESGAAIGDKEMQQEYETYFPMPGDSQDVVRQKAEARRIATIAMQKAAGEFYEPWKPSETEAEVFKKAGQTNDFLKALQAEEERRKRTL